MGDERPWIAGNRNKYRRQFAYYKKLSPWKEDPPVKGQRLYMLCYHILNVITLLCPWFRILFSKLIGINKYKWFSKNNTAKECHHAIYSTKGSYIVVYLQREKYLSQQLDSLLSQTYPNITIYIRDDGSKDDTLQIISHYVKVSQDTSGPKIVFLPPDGKNLGYMSSFWLLLRECGSADYYAFCDQDDVWLPDKVECGIAALEKKRQLCPFSILPLLFIVMKYEFHGKSCRNV